MIEIIWYLYSFSDVLFR